MSIPERWRSLFAPGTRWTIAAIVVIAGALGALAVGGTVVAIEATSTNEFCAGSCHAGNATPEWQASTHFTNPHGVAAGCASCHEPRAFFPMMVVKVQAINQVIGQMRGTISTPEKYEARRLEMAEKEWERMRKSDSAECRDCHQVSQMRNAQKPYTGDMHKMAREGGKTCIDCHKGVAHKLVPGVAKVTTGGADTK